MSEPRRGAILDRERADFVAHRRGPADRARRDDEPDVRLRRGGSQAGTLNIEWNDVQKNAIATLTGAIGNRTVKAKRIAP